MELDKLKQIQPLTVFEEVCGRIRPLLMCVKVEIVNENNQYLQEISSKSQINPKIQVNSKSQVSSSDESIAESSFITCMKSNTFFSNSNRGDIKYPHNTYSIYTPVNSQLDIDDEFVRTFPVLKKYKQEINTEAKAEFYSMISRQIGTMKQDPKQSWRRFVKKWIWQVDITDSILYYFYLLRGGYSAVVDLKEKFNFVQITVIEEHLQRYTKLFQQTNTLRKHLQFSIDAKEEINEISIVKTTKQLLCGSCLIYDCSKHKLQDHIIEEHNQFVHPKNKPNLQKKIQTATQLINHYYSYCHESITMDQQSKLNLSCSETCYLSLNKQKFRDLKYQLMALQSPSIRALINLGVQMFSYSPCHIALVAKSKMTCSLVFWYLIKVLNIQQGIERNFNLNHIDYLMSINISNVKANEKKKKNKKAINKKKEKVVRIGQVNSSHVTPICFHSFFHKQKEEDVEACTNCSCALRTFCLPSCLCDVKCSLRIKGCNCCREISGNQLKNKRKGQSHKNSKGCEASTCECIKADRECDPVLCHGCFPIQGSTNKNRYGEELLCRNNQFQLQNYPRLKLGLSNLLGGGLGLFASQFIPHHSIILVYTGQVIQNSLQQARQKVANDSFFYNFQFNEGSIDAKFFGNKARFINHDNRELQNCYAKIKFAKSDTFLAVYANRDLNKDEELFFDYDGDGTLFKQFRHKYPFIKQKLKPQKNS